MNLAFMFWHEIWVFEQQKYCSFRTITCTIWVSFGTFTLIQYMVSSFRVHLDNKNRRNCIRGSFKECCSWNFINSFKDTPAWKWIPLSTKLDISSNRFWTIWKWFLILLGYVIKRTINNFWHAFQNMKSCKKHTMNIKGPVLQWSLQDGLFLLINNSKYASHLAYWISAAKIKQVAGILLKNIIKLRIGQFFCELNYIVLIELTVKDLDKSGFHQQQALCMSRNCGYGNPGRILNNF